MLKRLVPALTFHFMTFSGKYVDTGRYGTPLYFGIKSHASLPSEPGCAFSSFKKSLPTYQGAQLTCFDALYPTRISFTSFEERLDTRELLSTFGHLSFAPLYPPGQNEIPACVVLFNPRSHV